MGTAFGSRNKVINGGFTINQRGYVSAAVLAAGAFGHDRWKAGASGGDYSFTQIASNTQITIAASKSLIQVIEDKNVSNTSYMLSWTGTAQARYGVNSATPSGAYASSPILITGQTVGTVMSIEFNTGTLGTVQLEPGTVITPFGTRLITDELELCQRYYQRISLAGAGDTFAVGSVVSTTAAQGVIYPPVTPRTKPTMITTGVAANYRVAEAGNNIACSAIPNVDSTFSESAIVVNFTVASGLTAGRACSLRAAAAAYLAFSAEL